MDRNRENALELEAEITISELDILECRANLEEDPRSETHQELLETLIDRRISLEQRFKNLTYNLVEPSPWSPATDSEPYTNI
jgi:hypothetical protein